MENLTPKIDDALGAVIELLLLNKVSKGGYHRKKDGLYQTTWGKKTEQGLKLSIINKLREYGVVLNEDASI